MRCLAYIKSCFEMSDDVVFGDEMGSEHTKVLEGKLKDNKFLEYSVRYYLKHYRSSSLFEGKEKYHCSDEFKHCFPSSSFLTIIEGSWWELQTSTHEAEEMHTLALGLRQLIFGRQKKCVIQAHINCGRSRVKLSHSTARSCFWEAWSLCKTLFGEKSSVSLISAKTYIDIVVKYGFKDTHTDREEVYK